MVETLLGFEFSIWSLVWMQKLVSVHAFGFESWHFTVAWWWSPGFGFLCFQ